ncbi:hypothetical protein MKU65_06255 [Leptospira interrogans]|uniref:hypothetical protein n=1 Tax=Leptospira interrogans TaxID=173 RepID=UPI00046C64C3|nr:hypothetical protein [Leptospira interrogans]ALN99988.1 hypothetical protein LIH_06450 [Leptospira interrogans serovar Hardjo-prajitno]MCH1885880.1 hypothetical protein [Leptospira interrogans]MCH1892123.1 hypothetical protein [Leptospira interrogans]MCH1898954.1 hypothetical protein [Leptospira interrogans]MCH1902316.1 hypothetical protein [Leptospira interrogans]
MNIDDHNKHVNTIKSEINLRRKIDREVITILMNSGEIVTGKINSFEKIDSDDLYLNFELNLIMPDPHLRKFNIIDISEILPSSQVDVESLNSSVFEN